MNQEASRGPANAVPRGTGRPPKKQPTRPSLGGGAPGPLTNLNGEIYYSEFPPGQGIASVGLEDGLPPEEQKKAETVRDQIF